MLLLLLLNNVIHTKNAITYDDGIILFNKIAEAIKSKSYVVLDFSEITILTATFLSSSIGQLYTHFESDEIDKYFRMKNITDAHNNLLEYVIMRAKEHKLNQIVFENTVDEVIYGD
jgi:hypothetical protein